MTNDAVETQPLLPGTPYLLDNHPKSDGRVLLSRALEDYAAIEWGYGPQDIATVFRTEQPRDPSTSSPHVCVRDACDNLVELVLACRLRTFARPFGGGTPQEMAKDLWELDDPFPRFATSAFDPERPFDRSAPPTHWIFVDRSDLARIVHVMCGGAFEKKMPERCDQEIPVKAVEAASALPQPATGLLRLETVEELTGMSRSTIYAKVAKNTFPEPLRLGSRLSRWRRHEVDEWLSTPT